MVRQARESGEDYWVLLEALLAQEMENRRTIQIAQRLRDARFPCPKDIKSFDFTAAPEIPKTQVLDFCRATFVAERENVIFGGGSH